MECFPWKCLGNCHVWRGLVKGLGEGRWGPQSSGVTAQDGWP